MTIVVPVLNGAHVLPLTVDAVLAQPADRIVYVDDGSTDATPEALRELESRDVRVSVVTFPENRGRAAARNAGASGAEGIVLFLDADVAPAAGYAERMAQALHSPEAIAVVGRLTFPDLDPEDPYHMYLVSSQRGLVSDESIQQHAGVPWRFFLAGVAGVQSKALNDAGGFPESIRYGEDLALACRLSSIAPDGLVHAPEAEAALYDVGTLETALEKLAAFARDLGAVESHCPEALRVGAFTSLRSSSVRDLAAIKLGLWRTPARAVQRTLSLIPRSLQPLAVRYLLGHTFLANVPVNVYARSA